MRILLLLIWLSGSAAAQTIGGRAAYNFLKLPSSPLITAAGGISTSYHTNEVSLTANNPSLLHAQLSSQLNVSFNAFLSGIRTYSLTGAHHAEGANTTFGAHIYYVDYGAITETDAAGNRNGEFRPVDFTIQLSAAKKYLERWQYGGTVKFIGSNYGQYNSYALAADIGLLYTDSAKKITASFVAKNMGVQLKAFASESEDLPFDLQVGITKRLEKAPFGFSLTAHHIHRFSITYNDTVFNNNNAVSSPSGFSQIFNHLVLATHVYLGQHMEATIGYNALRRQELSLPNAANGLTGFSAGLRIQFSKLQIMYARSTYQRGISYNQIGITTQLNKLSGLGK